MSSICRSHHVGRIQPCPELFMSKSAAVAEVSVKASVAAPHADLGRRGGGRDQSRRVAPPAALLSAATVPSWAVPVHLAATTAPGATARQGISPSMIDDLATAAPSYRST